MSFMNDNIKLLLHGDGKNNATQLRDYSRCGVYVKPIGNSHISNDITDVFGNSNGVGKFDSSGDSLRILDSYKWNLNIYKWTLDFYVRFNSVSSNMDFYSQYVDSTHQIKFCWDTTNGPQIYIIGGSGTINISQGAVTGWSVDTWYHIAYVKDGNNYYIFRDGVLVGSGTSSYTIPDLADDLELCASANTGNELNGYMSRLRLTFDSLWITTFTVPTISDYSVDWKTQLYLPMTGEDNSLVFTDMSKKGNIVKFNGSSKISSDKYYERCSAMYFPGTTSDYVTIDNPDVFNFNYSNFTIKCNFIVTTLSSQTILSHCTDDNGYFNIQISSTGVISFFAYDTGATELIGASSASGVVKLNKGHSLLFIRRGSYFILYVDNKPVANDIYSGKWQNYTKSFTLGKRNITNSDMPMAGYINELVVSVGETWDIGADFGYSNKSGKLHSLQDSLISCYKGWEPNNDLHDIVTGQVAVETGTVNRLTNHQGFTCLDFDGGTSNYFTLDHQDNYNHSDGNKTFSVWVNLDSLNSSEYPGIFQFKDFSIKCRDFMFFVVNETSTSAYYPNFSYTSYINDWHLIIGVWDSANKTAKIYMDNVLKDTRTVAAETWLGRGDYFWIGKTEEYNHSVDGKISDICVFDKILSEQEMKILYNNGRGVLPRLSKNVRQHQRLFYNSYLDTYQNYMEVGLPLNEISGTRFDMVSHAHAVDNHTVGYSNDTSFGIVASFNSTSSEYFSITNSIKDINKILNSRNFTISVFFKRDGKPSSSEYLLSCGNSSNEALNVWLTTDGYLKTFVKTDSSVLKQADYDTNVCDNEWHHILLTCVSTGSTYKLYVDNSLKDSDTTVDSIRDGSYDFTLGCYNPASPANYFNGLMKDFFIWNTTLDSTALSHLNNGGYSNILKYNHSLNRPYPSGHLIESFPMTEVSGDITGTKRGLIGTDMNSVTSDTGFKKSTCRKFTSSNSEYFNIPISQYDFDKLFTTNVWSLGIWFKSSTTSKMSMLGSADSGSYNGIYIGTNDGTHLLCMIFSSVSVSINDKEYCDGDWHRLIWTNTSESSKVYVDGILKGLDLTITSASESNQPLRIGWEGDSSWYWNGNLQQLDIFDVPLDETFIKNDYNKRNGRFYKEPSSLSVKWAKNMKEYKGEL